MVKLWKYYPPCHYATFFRKLYIFTVWGILITGSLFIGLSQNFRLLSKTIFSLLNLISYVVHVYRYCYSKNSTGFLVFNGMCTKTDNQSSCQVYLLVQFYSILLVKSSGDEFLWNFGAPQKNKNLLSYFYTS